VNATFGVDALRGSIGERRRMPVTTFFDLELTGYVNNEGHLAAKLEASYDLLLTQRLILQAQLEVNLYSKANLSV
jgi:copper resistance protein B